MPNTKLGDEIDRYELLKDMVNKSRSIVFFGGAGVSTESGIPDFRSSNGLYSKKIDGYISPEELISRTYFDKHTEEFYDFYRKNLLYLDAKPSRAHLKLAELEGAGKDITIVTQNIDGLHQLAGSKNVLELHGSVHRNYCMRCGKQFDAEYVKSSKETVPHCDKCGGLVKPDVVLYEEALDDDIVNEAVKKISSCELMIVAGTSLVVYPAAGLIRYFRGKCLTLINLTPTAMDNSADLVFHEKVGDVLGKVI